MSDTKVKLKDSKFFKLCRELRLGEDNYEFVPPEIMDGYENHILMCREQATALVEKDQSVDNYTILIGTTPRNTFCSGAFINSLKGESDFPIDEIYDPKTHVDPEKYLINMIIGLSSSFCNEIRQGPLENSVDTKTAALAMNQYIYLLFGDHKRVTVLLDVTTDGGRLCAIRKE